MADNPYAKYLQPENPYAKYAAPADAPVAEAAAPAPPATSPIDIPFAPAAPVNTAVAKDVAEAFSNIPSSAANLAKEVVTPILHPIDTVKGVYKIATDKPTRDAVGQFYKDRYGGLQNLHDTLIKDPVGAVTDLATVLTGGGTLAAKLPGTLGKIGTVTAKVGSAIDPIANTGRAASGIGRGVGNLASEVIGQTTSAGGEAFRTAAKAGFNNDKTFIPNLQDKVPATKVVEDLAAGIDAIKQKAQAQYRADMPKLSQATIDPTPIHEQFAKIMQDSASPGPQPLTKKIAADTQAKLKTIEDAINDATTEKKTVNVPTTKTLATGEVIPWSDWKEVRVPKPVDVFELDALKQKIGDMYREPGTRTPHVQRVITAINQKIRDVIGTEAPDYASIMDKYGEAQDMLNDIRGSLSAKNTAQADTTLMKLRRTLNDSPQGKRGAKMIDEVEAQSGKSLRPAIAGQALQNWLPGNGNYVAKSIGGAKAALGMTLTGAGTGSVLPAMAAAPLFSPKAMGYTAYGLGQAARPAAALGKAFIPTAPEARGLVQVQRPLDDERVRRALRNAGLE